MFDIFEQPWTLIAAAVLVLFGILTFRSIFPEKRRWWQLLVPVAIAAGSFGLDFFVQTDLEKINAIIDAGIKAVEEENCNAIGAIIADNYQDSYHKTKKDLMAHCRMELSAPVVEKNKKSACLVELSPPEAKATLFVLITFDKNSHVSQEYKSFILVKVKLYLQKQRDKSWLITRVEVLEIDRQRVAWQDVR